MKFDKQEYWERRKRGLRGQLSFSRIVTGLWFPQVAPGLGNKKARRKARLANGNN